MTMESFGGKSWRGPSARPRFEAAEYIAKRTEIIKGLQEDLEKVQEEIAALAGKVDENTSDVEAADISERLIPLKAEESRLEKAIETAQIEILPEPPEAILPQ